MVNYQERYDKGASTYNLHVKKKNYFGPGYIAEYLLELASEQIISLNSDIKVLDAGCGTGLIGVELRKHDFLHIDGVDFSIEMIKLAHKTGAYQNLIGWCDLNKNPPFFLHNQYDITICCGVFFADLVKLTALKWLAEVTKPGGIILLSTRVAFCQDYNFEDYYKKLELLKHLKLIDSRMDQPYVGNESNAHYWVFGIPETKFGS
ncbi:MAG: methyltransferase domain-containing protein [Symploca sp. SIO3C6]|uniref:Methyltransferase domain-containing protein n=1 Tax=Symploca sp. SIO1C4 TaxID=2607765 RepID=A0A6B3ND55_9CYAN|nr:methyltransferase domain-containing protein [Symploca sp. SIO3C6]NER31029.1 methyltransferase domain-containing protein [Symploca sp. SIO1C4]NET05726.1 methyltransferase domain-containing protein [Symploca sp. SIO2B6]